MANDTALAEMPNAWKPLAKSVAAQAVEQALVVGDLGKLSPADRILYYNQVCGSLGLNPLTKPFDYIVLNGKLTLYARKDCTEQLRNLRNISVEIVAREAVEDCYIVTARAKFPPQAGTGYQRQDESIGAVSIAGLKGEARANAVMKAETKAKRRVTLSACGLGLLDETEVESIPTAQPVYTVEAPTASTPARSVPALPSSSKDDAAQPATSPDAGSNGVVPSRGDSGLPHGQFSSTRNAGAESDALTIRKVETNSTRNKNIKKYFIVLSDGRELTTIKEPLGALCEALCQENAPVYVDTKETQWGVDLTGVRRLKDAEPEPREPDDPIF